MGGLIGYNYKGTMRNCYAAVIAGEGTEASFVGSLSEGSISESFWDIEINGFSDNRDEIDKNTLEMKRGATFTDAGWDFVGEGANGTEDVWRMCGDGIDYPRLSWEFSRGGDMDCPEGVGWKTCCIWRGDGWHRFPQPLAPRMPTEMGRRTWKISGRWRKIG